MKHLKKLASLALALVMVMALAVPAFADEPAPGKVRLSVAKNTDGTLNGHSYYAYAIFTGTPMTGSTTTLNLENPVEWGSAFMNQGRRASFIGFLKADPDYGTAYFNGISATSTAEEVAVAIANAYSAVGPTGEAALAQVIADAAAAQVKNDNTLGTPLGGSAGPEYIDVDTGYYLIRDINSSNGDEVNIAQRLFESTNIKTKVETTTKLKKQVQASDGSWVDVTDHDVGETFKFKITATLPENYSQMKDYWMHFTDTQTPGLGQPMNIKIYRGISDTIGTDITASVTRTGDATSGYGFTYNINDMKKNNDYMNLADSTEIRIEYESTLLDAKAVIGGDGNTNSVNLKTYGDGDFDDDATVFTFELDVNKVDGSNGNQALEGAEFTLYRLKDGESITGSNDSDWEQVGEPLGGSETDKKTAKFEFKGLEAGRYKLVETKYPDNTYNKIDPIYLKIEREYNTAYQDLSKLTITRTDAEGNPIANTTEDGNKTTGVVSQTVANNKGALLPETGGIGTTIFYIVGGVLLVGAVVLLIAKRRTSADEE